MSLTAAEVAELMRLVEQSGFDELTLEMDGIKLSLRRGAPPVSSPAETEPSTSRPHPPSPPVENVPEAADPAVHELASPLLGTFYRAPKPGAAPFVEVGVQVEEDTVVAIIEVMKLMNTVRAGVRGTVTEILVTDGQLAEYGQTLMRVRKAG
jgi:acetyl-CoA carboxylase biotin carboxyl carrier protein